MNSAILLGVLLAPNANPPVDPKQAIIERVLPKPAELLKALDKALAKFPGQKESGQPWTAEELRAVKAEFRLLWKSEGMARLRRGQADYLKRHFNLRELQIFEVIRGGEPYPFQDGEQERLLRKIKAFERFSVQLGEKLGIELGDRAERKLTRLHPEKLERARPKVETVRPRPGCARF